MMYDTISIRYAKVLFELDCKSHSLDKRLDDFTSIKNTFKAHPQLVRFMRAPHVTLQEKQDVIQGIFKEVFDPVFIHFLVFLLQRRRLNRLEQIARIYRFLVNQYLGKWEADLVTAVPVDRDNEAKLVKKLESMFNKKIILNKKIDPHIIGGGILVLSNSMLDWSVTGRLKKLKEHLIASVV